MLFLCFTETKKKEKRFAKMLWHYLACLIWFTNQILQLLFLKNSLNVSRWTGNTMKVRSLMCIYTKILHFHHISCRTATTFSHGHFGSEAIKSMFDFSRVNETASCEVTAARNCSFDSRQSDMRRIISRLLMRLEFNLSVTVLFPNYSLSVHVIPSIKWLNG